MTTQTSDFSYTRTLRLATFQIGSAMADILVTSVWNRIMITELGMPAWPVGLLIALRYLLAPLSLWAGFWSDTRPLWGFHRTPYIWLGRSLVVLSYPLLPFSLGRFELNRADGLGWLIAFICFVMYGTGTLLSGSPLLALVRDSAPKARQGLAVSLMETALIIMFPIVAISFSFAIKSYSLAAFWQLTLITMGVSAFFWFFAILGIERRKAATSVHHEQAPNFFSAFRRVWQSATIRYFCIFLMLATLAAWAQDAILEPFGGEVLQQDLAQTTRYAAYWQSATVVTLLGSLVLLRRRRPEQQMRVAQVGLSVMALGMLLLAGASFSAQLRLMQLALLIFGAGFGVYTFGGLSLMVAMTSDAEAGTYLGLWTITILLSRGIGISLGGILRDVLLSLTQSSAISYGVVFGLEALGLLAAVMLIARADIAGFVSQANRASNAEAHNRELQVMGEVGV